MLFRSGMSAETRERASKHFAEALAGQGVSRAETVILNELTTTNVVAAARAWRARLVVLPSSSARTGLAADLVGQLSSSLLLVGAKKR